MCLLTIHLKLKILNTHSTFNTVVYYSYEWGLWAPSSEKENNIIVITAKWLQEINKLLHI